MKDTVDIKTLRQFSLYDVPDVLGAFIAGKVTSAELKKLAGEGKIAPFSKIDDTQLRLHSHQLFDRNFVNVHTPYKRLFVYWSTGFGKTIAMLGTAMRFLQESGPDASVIVLGFSKEVFQNELLRRPQFGFVTQEEVEKTKTLRHKATASQDETTQNRYRDWMALLRRRLVSRKGNGKFQFMGWKKFTNRLFGKPLDPSIDTEQELLNALEDKRVSFDEDVLKMFKDFPLLVIGDEIHTTYNSRDKNMWGTALQMALDAGGPHLRAMFASATPINNKASEAVFLLNLLGTRRYKKEQFFAGEKLKKGAREELSEAFRGKVSYLFKTDARTMPRKEYLGEDIKSVPNLKFTRARMTALQQQVFEKIKGDSGFLHSTVILDAAIPTPAGGVAEDSSDMNTVSHAGARWKESTGLEWTGTSVGGPGLRNGLGKISPKYRCMVGLLHAGMRKNSGKYLLYHPDVHGTGVLFIGEILRQNGLVGHTSSPNKDTLCALCGRPRRAHGKDHGFAPARFVIVHGDLNKKVFSGILDEYNAPDNADGSRILVMVGSRMIGEAHDIKAVRNLWVLKRPDSIPSLMQIIGRGVRNFSHAALPREDWVVRIRLFTSAMHSGAAGYAEQKYAQKMKAYHVIREVQKAMHEMAVDHFITSEDTEPAAQRDPLGPLPYTPNPSATVLQKFPELYPYPRKDVQETVLVIKRMFAEQAPAWEYKDLLCAVRNPPKEWALSWNTSMVTEDVFRVAMAHLCPPRGFEVISPSACDHWNFEDTSVCVRGVPHRIESLDGIFVLLQKFEDSASAVPLFDSTFRGEESETVKKLSRNIQVDKYIRSTPHLEKYEALKNAFFRKYSGNSLERLSDAVCENDTAFQETFIKNTVRTVFRAILKKKTKNSFPIGFLVKMLFYYNAFGLVVWASQTEGVYPFSHSQDEEKSTLITACMGCPDWCPPKMYSKIRKNIADLVRLLSAPPSPEKIRSCMVPVGISFQGCVMIYDLKSDSFEEHDIEFPAKTWRENDVIIGYDEKSDEGLGLVKFKIRAPSHILEKHSDLRKMERGAICSSRPKKELCAIAEKLGIDSSSSILSVCGKIRAEIIRRELRERDKLSNVKWFYSHYEKRRI